MIPRFMGPRESESEIAMCDRMQIGNKVLKLGLLSCRIRLTFFTVCLQRENPFFKLNKLSEELTNLKNT
jgi:hypothetical protein